MVREINDSIVTIVKDQHVRVRERERERERGGGDR